MLYCMCCSFDNLQTPFVSWGTVNDACILVFRLAVLTLIYLRVIEPSRLEPSDLDEDLDVRIFVDDLFSSL